MFDKTFWCERLNYHKRYVTFLLLKSPFNIIDMGYPSLNHENKRSHLTIIFYCCKGNEMFFLYPPLNCFEKKVEGPIIASSIEKGNAVL